MKINPDAEVVLSTDHFIERAIAIAQSGPLVTLGIEPASPETSYGYIQSGAPMDEAFEEERNVERILEKRIVPRQND